MSTDTIAPVTSVGIVDRRRRRTRQIVATLLAIALALAVGSAVFLFAGTDPLSAYGAMVKGAFGSRFAISRVLVQTVPLLIIGLGLGLSFRGRVWNIGAEGQFHLGALVGASVAILLPLGTPVLAAALAILAGVVAGGVWGWVVGVLRARWEVNEIIASLLLNYVAFYLYQYVIRQPMKDAESFLPQSARVPEAAMLPSVPMFDVHVGLVIGLVLVPLMAYVTSRTPFGFRVGMMGLNPDAARAAGVRTGRMVVRLMVISGGMAGLAGIVQILGIQGRLTTQISAGFGFTAIIVALLGRLNPWGIALAALFMASLVTGGQAVQLSRNIPFSAILIIEALFVVFLLVAEKVARR